MIRPLTLGSIVATALAVTLLSGCTAPTPSPTAVPTPSASPRPTATIAPTPEPIAEPSPEPTATCDTVLTETEYASLAEDGLELNTDEIWQLGPAMSDLAADGALTCEWHRAGGDISVWFAQLAEDEAAWSAREAGLEASGWTVSDDPFTGTHLAPEDYDGNYRPSMHRADGVTYFVSYGRFLHSVAALQ